MKKGFTLIELLIVISIIGILAVALLPNILSAPATARDAGRKTGLNNVLTALEQYKATSNDYPLAAGTSAVFTDASLSGMTQYFKGGAAPEGATYVAAEVPWVGATGWAATTKGNSPVAYCKLPTTFGGGYSYVVAIKLEQKFSGPNALLAATSAKNCNAFAQADFPAAGGVNVNWYYLMQ